MRGMPRLHIVPGVLLAAMAAAAGADAGQPPPVRVGVRVSPPAPAGIADRPAPPRVPVAAMLGEADAIWRPHGVSLVPLPAGPSGDAAPTDVRLSVRFAPGGGGAAGLRVRLGAIEFGEEGTPGDVITLGADAVAATITAAAGARRALLVRSKARMEEAIGRGLGRVLAHELGHYLMASRTHAAGGLMRRTFDGRTLADPDRREFALHAEDEPRLRARLRLLSSPAPDPLARARP
jgi:hypothetical protein